MKKIILVLAVIFTVGLVFASCKSDKKEEKKEQVSSVKKQGDDKVKYQCPMKCEKEKTYDKEGKCPVCKMKLRKQMSENHEGLNH
jgi:uncharacterized paraquat-inducible protein A